MKTLISNPPYNLKWEPAVFSQIDNRFINFEVPPASNANWAFILTGIGKSDKSIFIMPNSVIESTNQAEKNIREKIIENNIIETIIQLPNKMFESTQIATVILVFNKNKKNNNVMMFDLSKSFITEKREQRGQHGGTSHTNRIYKKIINILTDEVIDKVLNCIQLSKSIKGFCKCVTNDDIKKNNYSLQTRNYIEIEHKPEQHRDINEIVKDINEIVEEKNTCKLTINETIAKNLGFDEELYKNIDISEPNKFLKKIKCKELIENDYFVTTKNKNEMKFENKNKNEISTVLIMTLSMWKQHIFYLNQKENEYLAELMDAILPKLMSGELQIE